jgi:hypothetical protein
MRNFLLGLLSLGVLALAGRNRRLSDRQRELEEQLAAKAAKRFEVPRPEPRVPADLPLPDPPARPPVFEPEPRIMAAFLAPEIGQAKGSAPLDPLEALRAELGLTASQKSLIESLWNSKDLEQQFHRDRMQEIEERYNWAIRQSLPVEAWKAYNRAVLGKIGC